jgi:hypothetical protein
MPKPSKRCRLHWKALSSAEARRTAQRANIMTWGARHVCIYIHIYIVV